MKTGKFLVVVGSALALLGCSDDCEVWPAHIEVAQTLCRDNRGLYRIGAQEPGSLWAWRVYCVDGATYEVRSSTDVKGNLSLKTLTNQQLSEPEEGEQK